MIPLIVQKPVLILLCRWDYESNVRYAQTAENVGFEFALSQIRFMAGYGAVCPLQFSRVSSSDVR